MRHKKQKSKDEEEEAPPAKVIKNASEFLAIIDQQKAFLKREMASLSNMSNN